MVMLQDGTVLNTCSTDALIEMLRFLKRSYWPFGWQTGNGAQAGGFMSAAMVSMQVYTSSDYVHLRTTRGCKTHVYHAAGPGN